MTPITKTFAEIHAFIQDMKASGEMNLQLSHAQGIVVDWDKERKKLNDTINQDVQIVWNAFLYSGLLGPEISPKIEGWTPDMRRLWNLIYNPWASKPTGQDGE